MLPIDQTIFFVKLETSKPQVQMDGLGSLLQN